MREVTRNYKHAAKYYQQVAYSYSVINPEVFHTHMNDTERMSRREFMQTGMKGLAGAYLAANLPGCMPDDCITCEDGTTVYLPTCDNLEYEVYRLSNGDTLGSYEDRAWTPGPGNLVEHRFEDTCGQFRVAGGPDDPQGGFHSIGQRLIVAKRLYDEDRAHVGIAGDQPVSIFFQPKGGPIYFGDIGGGMARSQFNELEVRLEAPSAIHGQPVIGVRGAFVGAHFDTQNNRFLNVQGPFEAPIDMLEPYLMRT